MGRGIHLPGGGLLGCPRGAGRYQWRRLHYVRLTGDVRLARCPALSARGLEGVEAVLDRLLITAIGGVVIRPVFDRVRQVLLLDLRLFVVMRVAIALAVADLSHQ